MMTDSSAIDTSKMVASSPQSLDQRTMTGDDKTALADSLVAAVRAVPGVRDLEPGITSTLRTLDARIRQDSEAIACYGLHFDKHTGHVIVEVALKGPHPMRETVSAVQQAVAQALAKHPDSEHGTSPSVLVRVQSL